MMKLFTISAIALLTCSCAPQEEADNDIVRGEVRAMFAECEALIERDGLMAEFAFLDSSEDFFWVPPGHSSAISYDSVRVAVTLIAQRTRSIVLSWDTLRIVPLGKTRAAYTGILLWTAEDTSGTVTRAKIIETGVVIRREGGWKLLCGQSRNLEAN